MPSLPEYVPKKPFIIEPQHQPEKVRGLTADVKSSRIYRNITVGTVGLSGINIAAGNLPVVSAFTGAGSVAGNIGFSEGIRRIHKGIEEELVEKGDFVNEKLRNKMGNLLPSPKELEKSHPHFLVDGKGSLVFLPAGLDLKQKIHDAREKIPVAKNYVPVRYRGVTRFSK